MHQYSSPINLHFSKSFPLIIFLGRHQVRLRDFKSTIFPKSILISNKDIASFTKSHNYITTKPQPRENYHQTTKEGKSFIIMKNAARRI